MLWVVDTLSAWIPTVSRYEWGPPVYPQWIWSDSEKLASFVKPLRLGLFVTAAEPTHPDCYRDTDFLCS